ncbi:hypothetical protein PHISP_06447 [Aspergillus sp. HF37]|nr:hypothetical protein PHISP_06447 [Aspergillus sp. HF37]
MRPAAPRNPTAGPDTGPEQPFPIRLSGPVIRGFGRGSKELGIPTANIPPDGLAAYPDLASGVYFGVVVLENPAAAAAAKATKEDGQMDGVIRPAVLSIGFNPFYGNTVRSVEIHIMQQLSTSTPTSAGQAAGFNKMPDFYSARLNVLVLGYIRPEYDYVSAEALVEDIREDCEVARRSLARKAYVCYLREEEGEGEEDVGEVRAWLRRF